MGYLRAYARGTDGSCATAGLLRAAVVLACQHRQPLMNKPSSSEGPSARLQGRLADRDNNFDILRLAAATMVLVGHSFFLAGHSEPLVPLTDAGLAYGGVLVFFAISGFLVTRSWLNEPRFLPFAAKRGLRIMPGLVVALVLTAYAFGLLTTTTGRLEYLSQSDPAEYVAERSLMLGYHTVQGRLFGFPEDSLPGVFEANPEPAVNGPLWTLPVEVSAYAVLALGGLLLLRRRWFIRIGATVLFIGAGVLVVWTGGGMAASLFAVFAGGVLLYMLRDRLKLSVGLFAAAVALWVASYQLPLVAQAVLTGLTLPYAVVFLALRGLDRMRWLTRPGDLSYGIYIYAWPVGQIVIDGSGTRNPAVVIALSGVLTYILAFASWRAIERPALRLKRRFSHPSVRSTVVGSEADLVPNAASSAP